MEVVTKKHLHKYERSRKHKDIYRCILPTCTHYNRADMIVGKLALCHTCGNEFLIRSDQVIKYKTKKLTCLDCANSKEAKNFRESKSMIEDLLIDELGRI